MASKNKDGPVNFVHGPTSPPNTVGPTAPAPRGQLPTLDAIGTALSMLHSAPLTVVELVTYCQAHVSASVTSILHDEVRSTAGSVPFPSFWVIPSAASLDAPIDWGDRTFPTLTTVIAAFAGSLAKVMPLLTGVVPVVCRTPRTTVALPPSAHWLIGRGRCGA